MDPVAGENLDGKQVQVWSARDRRAAGVPHLAPLLRHRQPSSHPLRSYPLLAANYMYAPLLYSLISAFLLVFHIPRLVKRFADLSPDETRDLWMMAKDIGVRLEQYHRASSLTFTIQDGPHSGQTVPHVHIHIVPRRKGDFENNDDNDGMMNEKNETLDLDIERKDRMMEEMAQEAKEYRALFS
uniref:HIT domain-containing protein n=1 Tax=Oryza meridionalis TaxID=40149 RepID=A0A0E0F209_9ORYZ